MFTTHTGRRYRLPTAAELRREALRRHLRDFAQACAIAALLGLPMFAHLLDK